MNQILITGYEEEKKSPNKKQKPVKMKKVASINTIVTIFAICIIILGICMATGSTYAREKINETVEANAKPTVEMNRNDDTNTIDIEVSHIRGIKEIKYKWNNGNEEIIQGNNQTKIQKSIPLIGGQNTLTVSVTEENGQTELSSVSNGVKVKATSKEKLASITYKWDDGAVEKIDVSEETYEGIINAPGGKHTLDITATDINGNIGTKTQVVVGDTAPTVTIKASIIDGKKMFVIDAEDDTGLANVEIILNDNTVDKTEVSGKTYHKEIEILQGENKIIVKAYNINELETLKGARYNN